MHLISPMAQNLIIIESLTSLKLFQLMLLCTWSNHISILSEKVSTVLRLIFPISEKYANHAAMKRNLFFYSNSLLLIMILLSKTNIFKLFTSFLAWQFFWKSAFEIIMLSYHKFFFSLRKKKDK